MAGLQELLQAMSGEPDPLAELDARLAGIRSRMPNVVGAGPTQGGNLGMSTLLAPYEAATLGAPTDFGGTTMDLFSLVKQIEKGKGGKGWTPSWSPSGGGGGGIVWRNDIGMAAPAMRSLMQLKQALGVKPLANASGGFRSHAQQKALYAAYLAGTHPATVARPGTSLHEKGLAIDFNTDWIQSRPDVRRWLLQHGWHNDVPGEPWHWSFRRSG